MRVALLFLVLACVVVGTYSDLVCGNSYCKTHTCSAPVASSSCRTPSVYRAKHAGKCACCPACVTLLNEGTSCKTYSKELGETPSAVCKDDLACLRGICTRVPTKN